MPSWNVPAKFRCLVEHKLQANKRDRKDSKFPDMSRHVQGDESVFTPSDSLVSVPLCKKVVLMVVLAQYM